MLGSHGSWRSSWWPSTHVGIGANKTLHLVPWSAFLLGCSICSISSPHDNDPVSSRLSAPGSPTSEASQIQLPANLSLEDFITLIRTVVHEEWSATVSHDPHSSRALAVSTAPNTALPLMAAPGVNLPSSTAASTSTPADTTTRVSQSQPLPVPSLTLSSLLPLPVPPPFLQSVATGRSGAGMLCVEGKWFDACAVVRDYYDGVLSVFLDVTVAVMCGM